MKRKLSFMLALITLLCTASCGDSGASDDTTAGDTTTQGDVTTAEPEVKSGVPAGTTIDGKVSIWYTTKASSVAETFVDLNPDETGDVLDDAIYAANRAVEERLGVTIDYYHSEIATSNVGSEIQKLVQADDDTYDIFNTVQWNSAPLAADGFFLNVKDMPYLSYDADWWDYEYMKEMTIGDNIYFLVGDNTVDRTRCLDCIFYNKRIYEDYFNDPDGLYSEVIDGKWTIDRMLDLSKTAYQDLDNDGAESTGDRLGLILNKDNVLDGFFYGAQLKVTSRDKDDLPVITLMNERASDLCDKVYRVVTGEFEGVFTYEKANNYQNDLEKVNLFGDGNILFLPGFLYTAENLRDMKDDYGIIPYPKANEDQETYGSTVHNIIRQMALPANCKQPENACAVLEELAFEGNRTILPAYYEVALKSKYARDDLSAQMIDIIRDGCYTDIALVYNNAFNKLGLILRDMAQQNKASLATIYAERITAAEASMKTFIEGYKGN